MADTLVVSCPKCAKEITAPATLQGKTIRCKSCGHVFSVQGAGKEKAGPSKKSANADTVPATADSADDDSNPYGLQHMSLAPRCPHCAHELESSQAIICVNCGYNIHTRQRAKTRRTIQTTGGDKFRWLLPGIICLLAVLGLIGWNLFFWFGLQSSVWDSWDESMKSTSMSMGARVWMVIISLLAAFFLLRFAIRRLIFNPHPPEQEVW